MSDCDLDHGAPTNGRGLNCAAQPGDNAHWSRESEAGGHKYVGADIAGLVISGGPAVSVTQQAQSYNLFVVAEIRAGIANPWCAVSSVFGRQDRTRKQGRAEWGDHSRCALPH